MLTSESTTNVYKALFMAWGEMEGLEKAGENPHFRSKFIPLETLMGVIKPVFMQHGLLMLQGSEMRPDLPDILLVWTRIVHVDSGEWVQNQVQVPLDKSTSQGAGSALTYGRRYGAGAILALVADPDDDGEGSMSRKRNGNTKTAPVAELPNPNAKIDNNTCAKMKDFIVEHKASMQHVKNWLAKPDATGKASTWACERVEDITNAHTRELAAQIKEGHFSGVAVE